ncbi:MAG TPA: DMT family transporter [Stellaceae bacterium]|nr:DMT family transporter [Stellaceae bacterium]
MPTSDDLSSCFPAVRYALAMAIIGTIGFCVTEAGLDPITMVFWRCVFATLFLGGWCLARGYLRSGTLSPRRLIQASIGGICIVLSWVAFFAAFRLTSIATTTIVYHVQPFLVVLLGVAFLRERIGAHHIVWMIVAFLGLVFASGLIATGDALTGRWLLGIALTLGAAALYAGTTIMAKELAGQRPEVTALCQTVVGVVLLAPFAGFGQTVSGPSWAWLVGIGVIHTGVAYILMYGALPQLATPLIGVLTFIYPLVAILIDWLVYAHPVSIQQIAGMLLIALGTIGVKLDWRIPAGRLSATRASVTR